jgi:pyruvate/2-oxoglutarate dehydrogenase complex dihydrolipoamide dehydrogenase (E3) component
VAVTDYDLGVIGGGTAGLVSAALAAGIGARTVLVEEHALGGECLWTGCVPSKALLHAAAVAQQARRGAELGIGGGEVRVDFARVMGRVREVVATIQPHDSPERFRSLGVAVEQGRARFSAPGKVQVEGRTLRARRWIVASGSRSALPPVPGLAEAGYLTHETVWELEALPASLLVLGAGAVGVELAQAFARLGSEVTLVDVAPRPLPQEDPELAAVLARRLQAEGVRLRLEHECTGVARVEGGRRVSLRGPQGPLDVVVEQVLLAAGRRANVEDMGLEALGVQATPAGIATDATLRTSLAGVFAAGDVVGPHRFTHVAEYHARLAVPNALFRLRRRLDYRVVPWCTFSDPEVARVGLSEAEAVERWGSRAGVHRYDHASLDRAVCDGRAEGLTKLVLDPAGRLVGAHIVGARAGETIHEAALAIRQRLKLSSLAGMIHVYPTYPESLRRAGDAYLRQRYAGGWARGLAKVALRWLGGGA